MFLIIELKQHFHESKFFSTILVFPFHKKVTTLLFEFEKKAVYVETETQKEINPKISNLHDEHKLWRICTSYEHLHKQTDKLKLHVHKTTYKLNK